MYTDDQPVCLHATHHSIGYTARACRGVEDPEGIGSNQIPHDRVEDLKKLSLGDSRGSEGSWAGVLSYGMPAIRKLPGPPY